MSEDLTPEFLDVEDVLLLHARQLARFGGATGIRDRALLESATAGPQASYGGSFLYEDIFEMAAAYLFGLAQNHPFVDGNKRVAAEAALVFLQINGHTFSESHLAGLEAVVMGVASGAVSRQAVAAYFRNPEDFRETLS